MNTILVTAGSHGLGRAIAEDLLKHNCNVAISYREHEADAQTFHALHRTKTLAQHAELDKEHQVTMLLSTVRAHFGRIDGLVHCAGSFEMRSPRQTNANVLNTMIRDNVSTTFFVVSDAIEHMRNQSTTGNIVTLASPPNLAKPYYAAYNAANAARLQLMTDYAKETEKDYIAVNAVTFLASEQSRSKPPLDMMPRKRYVPVEHIVETVRKLLLYPKDTGQIIELQ